MQYSKIASTLLLLATAAHGAPTPQASSDDNRIGVGLQGADDEGALTFLMSEHKLLAGQIDTFDIFEPTVYETLELVVGANFPQFEKALRCQILDLHQQPMFVTRGKNRDTTFSDAGNGRWKIETPSQVSQIICDPSFIADNRPLGTADVAASIAVISSSATAEVAAATSFVV